MIRFGKQKNGVDITTQTPDYLGYDITVQFKLQAKVDGGNWQNADELFTAEQKKAVVDYNKRSEKQIFSPSITARINSPVWKNEPIHKLPFSMGYGENYKNISYRYVETAVKYKNVEQKLTVSKDSSYSVENKGLIKSAATNSLTEQKQIL